MQFVDLKEEDYKDITFDQDTPDFKEGDMVEVTFIAEVSNYNPETNEYEVLLPYTFLQGRYNHAYFPRDSIEDYIEPWEEGAVYRDTTGDLYYRSAGVWLAFGSSERFDDGVFAWSNPEKIIDAEGNFV